MVKFVRCLKQGYTLSLIFNFALERTSRKAYEYQADIWYMLFMLIYHAIKKTTETLIDAVRESGLEAQRNWAYVSVSPPEFGGKS
jgi:hypothetical protein